MRPEINLLLHCAHAQIDHRRRKEEIAFLLRSEVDWEYIMRLAGIHGTFPLLYRTLSVHFAGLVPQVILDQLRSQFLFNIRHNLLLTAELCQLIRLFGENGIPTVPLKGPVLTVSFYGDLGMRPFSDLDLLFQRKDVPQAKALLVSQGYRIPGPLGEAPQANFNQNDSGGYFIRNDSRVCIDLLWGMPGEFLSPDFQPFWERVEERPFEGRQVLTFSPEDWILYLSLHQATHGWSRLLWLTDLETLINNHPRMDWDTLVGRAELLRCRRVLFISLALIHSFLLTPLPEKVLETLEADARVQGLARIAGENLFREGQTALGRYRGTFFFLRVTDRWRDRIRFCILQAMMPTVVDWLAWPLPRPLFFLYFFFHPLRIAWNLSRRFMKSIFPPSAEKTDSARQPKRNGPSHIDFF